MIRLKKVLFATDFSELSIHALKYALSFAKEYEAKLIILHVIEDVLFPLEEGMLSVPLPEFYKNLEDRAEETIGGLVPKDEAIQVETTIRTGTPFVEIIKAAKENEADLIVMGTHGRTGMEHVLLGSTAEKVVRKAPCPVLTIRHPEHGFVMP